MRNIIFPLIAVSVGVSACGVDSNSGNESQGIALGANLHMEWLSKDLEQNRAKLSKLRADSAAESIRLDQCRADLRSILDQSQQASDQASLSEKGRQCEAIENKLSLLKLQITKTQERILELEGRHRDLSLMVTGHRLKQAEIDLESNKKKRDAALVRQNDLEKNFIAWSCNEKLSGEFVYQAEQPLSARHGKVMECSVLRTKIDQLTFELVETENRLIEIESLIQGIRKGEQSNTSGEMASVPLNSKQETDASPDGNPLQEGKSLQGCHWIYSGSTPLYKQASAESLTLTPTQGAGKGKPGFVMGGGTVVYVHGQAGNFLHVTVKQGTFFGRDGFMPMAANVDLVKTSCP